MCGLAAVLRLSRPLGTGQSPIPEPWLDALDGPLRRRGPDGSGRFRDASPRPDGLVAHVAIVHRRLAVLDRAGGAQPMVIEPHAPGPIPPHRARWLDALPRAGQARHQADGPSAIAFNGCVYNHRDLRASLRAQGERFASDHSDTEALARALRRHGPAALGMATGPLAAAYWDRPLGTLLLLRDRFGQRPLYATAFTPKDTHEGATRRAWAVASSPASLLRLLALASQTSPAPSPPHAARWLAWGFDPLGADPTGALLQVPPGACALIDPSVPDPFVVLGRMAGPRPSGPEPTAPPPAGSPDPDPVERADRAIAAAVHQCLESDVPMAALLSGGIDSSLVCLHARRALGRLSTLCVAMPDPRYDESAAAARVAAIIGSDHLTLPAPDHGALDHLGELIDWTGLPAPDSSLLPTAWACKAARAHATVLLTGDGGDELFFGYQRHTIVGALAELAPLAGALPPALPRALARALQRAHPKSRRHKLARAIAAAAGLGYAQLLMLFDPAQLAQLLPSLAPSLADPARFLAAPAVRSLDDARAADLALSLPGDMLRKTDTAAMACATELRAPLLADPVADLALALSPDQLMPRGRRKGLLRAVAARHFPPDVVHRPKSGFAYPIGELLRHDPRAAAAPWRDLLLAPDAFAGLPIDRAAVASLWHEHTATPRPRADHAQRLFALAAMALWARWLAGLTVSPQA